MLEIVNVGFKPAPQWLVDMRGQIGRKAYWRGVGYYEITGVCGDRYKLGKCKVTVHKDDVKVL